MMKGVSVHATFSPPAHTQQPPTGGTGLIFAAKLSGVSVSVAGGVCDSVQKILYEADPVLGLLTVLPQFKAAQYAEAGVFVAAHLCNYASSSSDYEAGHMRTAENVAKAWY